MNLSNLKKQLLSLKELNFVLPDGSLVPNHFHITEVGEITKIFMDCGGTIRHEKVINFQLWLAGDLDHRLHPQKLSQIIELSEKQLGFGDFEIEVEYQHETIGKYGLEMQGENFILTPKQTNCLASDKCGIAPEKLKVKLSDLQNSKKACCAPGENCK